jgi:REP element-mobilizing transposase RayT
MLAKEKYPCRIYSFIFMTNHVHLILEPVSDSNNLAYFMKYISQRHGQYINKGIGRMVITDLKSNWRWRWIENLNSRKQGESLSLKCEPCPD